MGFNDLPPAQAQFCFHKPAVPPPSLLKAIVALNVLFCMEYEISNSSPSGYSVGVTFRCGVRRDLLSVDNCVSLEELLTA